MQKFEPEQNETTMAALTERKNVIVADEAHRTQYGFNAKYDDKGKALNMVMPNI